jgi:hypothetical protein
MNLNKHKNSSSLI